MTIYLTEEMFSSGQHVAQGEINIWMKKYAPRAVLERRAALSNMKQVALDGSHLILGHSESGHHHVLEAVDKDIPLSQAASALIDATNATIVEFKLMQSCVLVHQKHGPDTHKTYVLPPGEYIKGTREEQTISGWQSVRD